MPVNHLIPIAALALAVSAGCLTSASTPTPTPTPTPPPPAAQVRPAAATTSTPAAPANPIAKEMAEFVVRVEQYATLREQLTASAPKLSDKATPEELDAHQRALAARIIAARTGVKRGDIFVPDMQVVVRSLMARVFSNPAQRAELKATIDEEYPAGLTVVINTRYPADVPLVTMPPEVLKNLPHLPKECEYRFLGESLILLDTRAHLVMDVMSFALPKN